MKAWQRMGVVTLMLIVLVGAAAAAIPPTSTAHAGSTVRWSSPAPAVEKAPARSTVTGTRVIGPGVATETFPRTVLVETYTGVWCPHCPAETQALYDIDLNTSHTAVAIAEIHVCYYPPGSGPCYDNFPPSDYTMQNRTAFYGVCGEPDVYFDGYDGNHNNPPSGFCGASNSMPQMKALYQTAIDNSANWPGNVSISENSFISGGTVTAFENITSGITGSYNAVTYLLQYIGKRNLTLNEGGGSNSGLHDVGNVVEITMHSHPVSLTAGATSSLSFSAPLNASWNPHNLSVISFVQDNATKSVENANYAPVTTELTSLSATKTNLSSRGTSTVTVTVKNSSTGAAVDGATVSLGSSAGGMFSPASGATSPLGTFTSVFTAPTVASVTSANVTANVTASGYTPDTAMESFLINPLVPPSAPQGLTVVPASGEVVLNWSAPATGALGLTYNVYSAGAATGPFSLLATTSQTTFTDPGLATGQTLWFQVNALDSGGYSPNATTVSATSVTFVPTGLPANTAWWISSGTSNFTFPNPSAGTLFLGAGAFSYEYGAKSFAVVAPNPFGSTVVGTLPQNLPIAFQLRLGTLQGTVTPAGATVTLDGAPLLVSAQGAFSWSAVPGSYYLNASASGYTPKSEMVTLYPGNQTTAHIALEAASIGGTGGLTTSNSNGGWSNTDTYAVIGIAGVVAVAGVLGTVMMKSKTRTTPRPKTPTKRAPPRSK